MAVDLKGRRVLVVGAGGFIGQHVMAALEAADAKPMGFDIAGPAHHQAHLPWVTGNVTDVPLLETAASGCYGVVFLANSSLPGTSNVALADEVAAHVQTSIKAAEICCAQGVKRFVFASSGGTVYGHSSPDPIPETALTQPRNAYGVSKLAIEHYLRLVQSMRDMETVSLRISNPYGEGQRANRNQGFVAAAMQHLKDGSTMPIWGDGSVERDFIHVSDAASAFVSALMHDAPPNVVNIGAGEARSLLEILKDIERVSGVAVKVAFEPGRTIDVKRNILDISRARSDLDWAPQIRLRDGLKRTYDWWDAQ